MHQSPRLGSIKTIEFQGQVLPAYLSEGFHSRFIHPIAREVCKGRGLDIGCGKREWALVNSHPVDLDLGTNALDLPLNPGGWDYIFSSHCLEHIEDYRAALKYWTLNLRVGGVLFLYLPHPDCLYWKPELMPTKKHLHQFDPEMMTSELESLGFKTIFASERDLAWSFAIFGEKQSGS